MEGVFDKKNNSVGDTSAQAIEVPYDLDLKFGIKKLCDSISPVLSAASEHNLTEAEVKFIQNSCGKLSTEIRKELKLRSPTDSEVDLLLTIKDISDSISENVSSQHEFIRRAEDFDAGRLANSSEMERQFLEVAISECGRTIVEEFAKLSNLQVGEAPLKEKLKKMAQVLLASATLLSMGGKEEEKSFQALDNTKAPTDVTSVESVGQALTIDDADNHPRYTKEAQDNGQFSQTLNPSISNLISNNFSERAQITFPLFSSISDTLWVGAVYCQNPGGTFTLVNRSFSNPEGNVEADIQQIRFSVSSNKSFPLLTPIGYAPDNVRVTDANGQSVNIQMADSGRSFTVSENKFLSSIEINYSAVEAEEHIELSEPVSTNMARSSQTLAMVEALKSDPSRVEDVLSAYFSNYTYLLSNDLAAIVEGSGVLNRQEIYGNIKYADCDTASIVAAGLLNQAGIKAGVICGYTEQRGEATNAHGKIVYQDEQGKYKTFECTKDMKRVLKNVSFEKEDKNQLRDIFKKFKVGDSVERRLELYQEFNEALDRILSKNDYDEYEWQPESQDDGERTLFDNYDTLRRELSVEKRDLIDASLALLGVGSLLSAAVFAGRTAAQKYRKSAMEAMVSKVENPLHAKQSNSQHRGNLAQKIENEVDYRIACFLNDFGQNTLVDQFKEKSASLAIEQKQVILKYLSVGVVVNLTVDGPNLSIANPVYSWSQVACSHKIKKQLQDHPNDVIKIDDAFKIAIKATFDEEKIAKSRAKIPEYLQSIIINAQGTSTQGPNPRIIENGNIPEERSSNRRSMDRSDEFYGYREYSPGESAQNIDWVASSRTGHDKLLVREYRAPRTIREDKREPVQLVLDISACELSDLEKFAGTLMFADKNTRDRIESIAICAHGEILQTIEPKLVNNVVGMRNLRNIESLVNMALEKTLEINPALIDRDNIKYNREFYHLRAVGRDCFPVALLNSERKVKVIGI